MNRARAQREFVLRSNARRAVGIEIASNERSRDEYAPPARTALTSASEGDSLPPSCACEPFKNHARQSVNHSRTCVAGEKSPRATRRHGIHVVFRSFPHRRRTRTRASDETHRGEINQFIHSARATRTQTDDRHPTGIRPSIRHPSIHPSIHRASPRDDEVRRSSRTTTTTTKKKTYQEVGGNVFHLFLISSCLCGEFVAEEANVPALASGSRSKRCAHKRRSRARRRSVLSSFRGNTNVKVFV